MSRPSAPGSHPATAPVEVRPAAVDDVAAAAPLFDAYRQFYGQPSDIALAARFLTERLSRAESQLLLAWGGSPEPLGFVQLYPSYSSVACRPILVLNDLYVSPEARGLGVARALLGAAAALGRQRAAARLVLETAETNTVAQALYEGVGFVRESGFRSYTLNLD